MGYVGMVQYLFSSELHFEGIVPFLIEVITPELQKIRYIDIHVGMPLLHTYS